ncbi:PREDICTED: aminopeptidase N [Drosophila arizonae]|uniref:Aminopeptidase n=1 Tax=Drosophila arizonae TaxID=7263 RepID=A0ABM1Q1N1_DROAR|nr:PREDICTED: aminopeptidase N [Drosophila arizonae]
MARWIVNSLPLLLLLIAGSQQARLISPPVDEFKQLETKGDQSLVRYIEPRADNNSVDNYRLPNNTVPISYNVELWTEVHKGTRNFSGVVKIDIQVVEDTKMITLHYRQISSFNATIQSKDSLSSQPIAVVGSTETTREFLILTHTDTLKAGSNWTVTINYTSQLRLDMGGFYISSYTDDNGAVHYLATTQFESTNARHAFPCYDEPAKRANFTITIHHDPSYTAICNMPVDVAKSSSGITAFQTTPRMSTYLIAFIVSDFESTGGELNGLPQRVFSRKGRQSEQEWALWSGLVVESSLAKYFGVPFALPKLDQAGIPDFSAGAMENWGLATYREQYMWWTKESSTINQKTNIANIIGHEYTHMWFGDLVSIKWWTYLWLKEGFATLYSYESNDIAFPEWDTYQIFHVSDYYSALINDASLSTPMSHYVQTPSEISNRYGTISYAKPASVLYMLKNAFTDAVFRRGLELYLKKHQFNSTDEWDLFASLQNAADELSLKLPFSVADIFSSWSTQVGFPLLTVQRNYDAGTFSVTQQRFLNNKTTVNTDTWYVPINYATASSPDYRQTKASHYLPKVKEHTISDVKIASSDWLLLNKQSTGFYRILYDERNYRLIAQGLRDRPYDFHTRNRAQLMHDAYRFVDTGRISHSILLDLMSYLRNENQYAPWSTANSILNIYDTYLRGDANYAHFREFVIELVEDIFVKLGVNEIPGEHYLNNYLRVILVSLACQVGSTECYKQSHTKLQQYLQDGVVIEPTLRNQAYCAGLRQAEDTTFDLVLKTLFASTDDSDRSFYISALGCLQNASQLKKFFESSLDMSNSLRTFERTSLLDTAHSRGEIGLTASLDFLDANWKAYGDLNPNEKPLDDVLRRIAGSVVSESQKNRLNALVAKIKANGAGYLKDNTETSVQNAMKSNFDWLDVHRQPIMDWLAVYRRNGSSSLSASLFVVLAALVSLLCHGFN